MISLVNRSYQKELLDSSDIPFEDIRQNMVELDFINTRLGGHRITTAGISELMKNTNGHTVSIVEIGCGGGDNLRAIKRWALKNKISVKLSGIDINEACIAYARRVQENDGIDFVHSDYRNVMFSERPQIVFSSLFCHHFTDEELILQLKWMHENSGIGFFINDLHRHPAAYYSIRLLTKMFSKSYLVKNDAPLSVSRGFKRKDWTRLFSLADIETFNCHWRWAFRWLIVCKCN
jgi:2-polyprenyl-3-methyl-5-hydroxy-6-metoxy-1,4-benzoquinol methylase